MRYRYMLVLPLLLALSQLAVGSCYSSHAAQQQQEQQLQQCPQQALNSYAADLQMGLASASCPAQLHPAAEAPATAASANGIAATNNTQHMKAQQIHSGSTEGSRNAGSDSQGAEQQCRGNGDCNWQTCIVRFAEYKMLSEHKQALGKVSTAMLCQAHSGRVCHVCCATSNITRWLWRSCMHITRLQHLRERNIIYLYPCTSMHAR